MLARWIGGAAMGEGVEPPTPPPHFGGRFRVRRELIDAQRLGQINDDDILLAMCGALCAALGRLK